jgi:flagellar motor switch protein FliN/FliY
MDEPNEQEAPREESEVVMETAPEEQAAEQGAKRGGELCAALGAALTPALHAAGAGSWQIQPSPEASGTSLDKQALCFALTLTGNLAGQCFVAISKQDAATLVAATGKPPASILLKVLQGAATGLAARLSSAYEGIAITVGKAKAVSSGRVAAGRLEAIGEGAAALWLSFDPQLAQSIADPDGVRRALAGALGGEISQENLDLVLDVPLSVTLRFGQRQLALREVLDLASGSVVELDRQVDEPVELILDGRVIARGEAVIVDGNYGVRVTEVIQAVSL